MRISEEVIKYFSDREISVRWYPESTYEEFYKRIWQEQYDSSYSYYKNVADRKAGIAGKYNTQFQDHEKLQEYVRRSADSCTRRYCDPYNFDMLYIEYQGGEKLIMKKISVKSKEITQNFIQHLIHANEKRYRTLCGEIALTIQRIMKVQGMNRKFSIYPTSYGIGVWRIYNYSFTDDCTQVEELLKSIGIEYSNEVSEAGWVYRYKILKSRHSLQVAKEYLSSISQKSPEEGLSS